MAGKAYKKISDIICERDAERIAARIQRENSLDGILEICEENQVDKMSEITIQRYHERRAKGLL